MYASLFQLTKDQTFRIDEISPWINRGGVQLIPTATTCLHALAIEAHSKMESPLTTLIPSLEAKVNHAGISIASSSRSSAYACTITFKARCLAKQSGNIQLEQLI